MDNTDTALAAAPPTAIERQVAAMFPGLSVELQRVLDRPQQGTSIDDLAAEVAGEDAADAPRAESPHLPYVNDENVFPELGNKGKIIATHRIKTVRDEITVGVPWAGIAKVTGVLVQLCGTPSADALVGWEPGPTGRNSILTASPAAVGRTATFVAYGIAERKREPGAC